MMKKALLAFAIVAFVACNNEAPKTEETKTDSTVAPVVDSAVKAVDSTVKAVDSTVKAVVDSVKK